MQICSLIMTSHFCKVEDLYIIYYNYFIHNGNILIYGDLIQNIVWKILRNKRK